MSPEWQVKGGAPRRERVEPVGRPGVGKRVVNLGHLPGRKRAALSVIELGEKGATVRPLAYFVSEAAFKEFRELNQEDAA